MNYPALIGRTCYGIAKSKGYREHVCKRMYALGFMMTAGLGLSDSETEMLNISAELLSSIRSDYNILNSVGTIPKYKTAEWEILTIAYLKVSPINGIVTVEQRLSEIEKIHGKSSKQYQDAIHLVKILQIE